MSTPARGREVEFVADLVTAALPGGEVATVMVVAHEDPALFESVAGACRPSDRFLTGLVAGHAEHHRAATRRPLDLEEPRWNDVVADVVVIEPEPNHWTTTRLLASACAVRLPEMLVVVLPADPVLEARDAYPPGSVVPTVRRHPSVIGGTPLIGARDALEARWHYASDEGGVRNGVRAAIDDFSASGNGDWTTGERDGIVWMLCREAEDGVRERVAALTRTSTDPDVDDEPTDRDSPVVPDDVALEAPVVGDDLVLDIPAVGDEVMADGTDPAGEADGPRDGDAGSEASGAGSAVPSTVPAGPDPESPVQRGVRQLRTADEEIAKLKEQRHRLRGQVGVVDRLELQIAETARGRERDVAERDRLVARVELRLHAAIRWQTNLREDGDRLRLEVRELRGALDRSRADLERGERAHGALRALAAEGAPACGDLERPLEPED